ncbi:MAG TPA: ABC transporter permease [Methanomicrobiales archaeon]|nr:ABC transporter permease [Methanomicrobiales archaeon]
MGAGILFTLAMTYLVYVAGFGVAVTYLLWLRDARILFRTGLPGYRRAAYHGVLYAALALVALNVTLLLNEIAGLALVLAALYLQGREKREKVFSGGEPALDRLLGKAPRREDKGREQNKEKTG